MRSRVRRPSPALAVSLAAMAVAIGGTAIVAQAGGGGSDTGKIVGYAQVKANGDVRGSKSLNVRNSHVTLEKTSAFCFRNLPFNFKGAQVTVDYSQSEGSSSSAQVMRNDQDCAPNAEVEVATSDFNSFDPEGFFVVFYK